MNYDVFTFYALKYICKNNNQYYLATLEKYGIVFIATVSVYVAILLILLIAFGILFVKTTNGKILN